MHERCWLTPIWASGFAAEGDDSRNCDQPRVYEVERTLSRSPTATLPGSTTSP